MFCVLFLAVLSKAKRTETRAGDSMQRRNALNLMFIFPSLILPKN